MPRSPIAALLTVPLLAGLAACTTAPDAAPAAPPPDRDPDAMHRAVTALPASLLEEFGGCDQLLTYYQANALEEVGPYGIGGGYYYGDDSAVDGDGGDMAAGVAEASRAAPEHSTTNVQEQGVDEPDLIKTDGRIIVTAVNGRVRVVDVASEQVIATVSLPGRQGETHSGELLLNGSTLIVLAQEWGGWVAPTDNRHSAFPPSRTLVTTVDLSDPSAPRTLGSMRLEGSYVAARMIDDTIRLVMRTEPPGLQQTAPTTGTLTAEAEAEQANRDLINASTIDDWIPHVQTLDSQGQSVSTERLVDCDDISRPRDPAGLTTLSVLTFDVGSSNPSPTSATGLVASGSTVYASTDRLVVTTNQWDTMRWGGGDLSWPAQTTTRTDLHTFDISDPSGTTYQASGTVDGFLLSQWAIDEQDGVLRVATTTDPREASQDSESSLIMMREDGDELVVAGRVDGLGVTEQIRAVRYLSPDVAALVTFRQTDPLYLVDTSDATAPRVAGELKIPGYSAYLHPVGTDQLLGVGQDADPKTGETKGLQVSLFDISNLAAPRQTEVLTWADSYSSIEWDHRAFTYWPASGQAFIPVAQYGEEKRDFFSGVLALGVGEGALSQNARISTSAKGHEWGEGALRTVVIGDELWALDYQGLSRFDLDTMTGGWVVDLP